jgi:hypothetical protein
MEGYACEMAKRLSLALLVAVILVGVAAGAFHLFVRSMVGCETSDKRALTVAGKKLVVSETDCDGMGNAGVAISVLGVEPDGSRTLLFKYDPWGDKPDLPVIEPADPGLRIKIARVSQIMVETGRWQGKPVDVLVGAQGFPPYTGFYRTGN